MTYIPSHFGLFFGQSEVALAQAQRTQEPLSWAWAWFDAEAGAVVRQRKTPTPDDKHATTDVLKPALDPLGQALADATRYRFADDHEAGGRAIHALRQGLGLGDTSDTLAVTLAQTVTLAHLYEMLRSHPALTFHQGWQDTFRQRTSDLLAIETSHPSDRYWQLATSMATSVVLEDEAQFDWACNRYHEALEDIHPEGYFKSAVEGKDLGTLTRQWHSTCALALTAEMATQTGVNLWQAQHRGVSVGTAISYLVYYYFFPDKWKWATGVTNEVIAPLMRDWGGFMEMAGRRTQLLRGSETLLEECRPFFSVYAGGLTTLSHGATPPAPPKKRGLFG